MGNGANTFTAAGIVTETITTGTGIDTFNFTTARLLAADTITAGTARDVLNLTGSTAAVYALQTATLSGIDTVNYTTADVADGLTVNTAAVAQSELGLVIVATDATAGANTAAIFDASGVATGSNVTVTVNAGVAANLGLATNAADVIGGAGSDIITLGSAGAAAVGGAGGGYVVRGNAGADTIAIGANATGVIVNINSANDGGAQGATSGFDVITGFTTAVDGISFTDNVIESVFQTTAARGNLAANARAGNANVVGAAGGVGVLAAVTDAAVNFNNAQDALVITQIGGGTTDAQLTDLAFIASKINVLGVTAAATDGGIVVVQGQTKSMIYLYVEQDGTANAVATSELKLLAQVDTNTLVAGDLFVM